MDEFPARARHTAPEETAIRSTKGWQRTVDAGVTMWNWNSDCSRAYAETDDPRLLLIIERDDEPEGPDGDCYAPAYFIESRYGYVSSGMAGSTFNGDDELAAYLDARNHWNDAETAERYMRIFHGVAVYEHDTRGNGGGYHWVTLDTPAWRDHVGIEPDAVLTDDNLNGDHIAWLDGDVFSIGYAVMPERTTTETPIDPTTDLEDQGWEIDIEVSGFYGEEYAKEAAADHSYGIGPNLPPFLDGTLPLDPKPWRHGYRGDGSEDRYSFTKGNKSVSSYMRWAPRPEYEQDLERYR
jgi:hypothetical protein